MKGWCGKSHFGCVLVRIDCEMGCFMASSMGVDRVNGCVFCSNGGGGITRAVIFGRRGVEGDEGQLSASSL